MAKRRTIREVLTRHPKIADGTIEEVVTVPSQNPASPVSELALSDTTLLEGIDINTAEDSKLIELYRKMENDAVVAAALDLYADNATQVNEKTKHVASIECKDPKLKEELNDFLWNVVKIDIEAWQIVRDLARDGKIFLDTRLNENEWGFIPVQDPSKVNALTKGQNNIEYFVVAPEDEKEKQGASNSFTVLHVKNEKNLEGYTVEDKDRFIAGFNTREIVGKMSVGTDSHFKEEDMVEELLVQTGRSSLANIVTTYQTLSALEDAVFINRLTKSTEFKIVQVDVSESNNKQAKQILDAVKNAFKSSESIDMTSNRYQNRQSPIPISDFIYVPTKGAKGSVTIETVGGEVGEQKMADIDYYRNKEFAGLGVLKAYLGFEETTPGGLGDGTLTMLDERFGRKVLRFQSVLKNIVSQMISFYWRYSTNSRTEDNLPAFEVLLGKVSTKEDAAKQERLDKAVSTARSIIDLAKDDMFIENVDFDKLFKYIFNEIIGIDTALFDNEPHEDTIDVRIKEIGTSKKSITEKHKSKKHIVERKSETYLKNLLKKYSIYIETSHGNLIPLSRILDARRYRKGILSEATYNQLKDASKSKDPARLKKSKKIIVKYAGIDKKNMINFTVTAEDPAANKKAGRPTSYKTKISLKDLAYLVKATIEDSKDGKEGMTEKDLVNMAIQGDVSLSCNCPASKYWGQQYLGTKDDYSLDKNDIAPTKNIPLQPICKHTLATLTVLPFWYNTIVRDLRTKGVLPSVMTDKEKDIVAKSGEEEENE